MLSKPDVATNQTCQALVILDTATGATRSIDTGGERIPETYGWRGVRITDGWPAIITPRWSVDGRYVGYLKRMGGIDQLWVAQADGSGAQRMSDQTAAVEDWRWADAGQSLLYTTRLGAVAASEAIDREGRTGWLSLSSRVLPRETQNYLRVLGDGTSSSGAPRDPQSLFADQPGRGAATPVNPARSPLFVPLSNR